MLKLNKIYNMDCLEGMKQLDTNSVDLIATDPPYQLSSITKRYGNMDSAPAKSNREGGNDGFQGVNKGFMGKEWDVLPTTEILKECLRVLKHGAFAFWMMTPRQDSQLEFLFRLREAGFVISFSPIYHTFASGFPKSADTSKLIDKRLGKEREIVGEYKHPDGKDRNWKEHKNASSTLYEMGMPKDSNSRNITAPASEQAKKFEGSKLGCQLKPAVEVVIVSMKPLDMKSYVDQALSNGKGITWLDDCRIPIGSDDKTGFRPNCVDKDYGDEGLFNQGKNHSITKQHNSGRFPANLLCCDDVLNDGKVTNGKRTIRKNRSGIFVGQGAKLSSYGVGDVEGGFDDSGSFSRYFDLNAWWQEKIKKLPEEVQKTFPFLICPKAAKGEKNERLENMPLKEGYSTNIPRKCVICNKWEIDGSGDVCKCDNPNWERPKKQNFHPTCKPLKLMSWLIILGSREKNIILDPFLGSGTTAIAAKMLGRKYIGFEMEKEYFEIAEQRLKGLEEPLSRWF